MTFCFATEMRKHMEENHRDKTGSKLIAAVGKLWLPPLSPRDQEKLDRLHNNPKKAIIKEIGFSAKTLSDWLHLLGEFLIPIVIATPSIYFIPHHSTTRIMLAKQQH